VGGIARYAAALVDAMASFTAPADGIGAASMAHAAHNHMMIDKLTTPVVM